MQSDLRANRPRAILSRATAHMPAGEEQEVRAAGGGWGS